MLLNAPRLYGWPLGTVIATALSSLALLAMPSQATGDQASHGDRTIVLRHRAGPYHYWTARNQGRAYRHAVDAFGRPSSRGKDTPPSNLCTVRWESLGIDVGFAGAVGGCADTDLRCCGGWFGMRIWGSRWETARGLGVGDPVRRIRELYPRARYVSEPPKPGEWILVSEWQQDRGRVPLLIAHVGAGRVVAVEVPAGFIF